MLDRLAPTASRGGLSMDYKKLLEEIRAFLSNCECVRYGELVGAPWPYNHDGPMVYTEPEDILLDLAATAITDLLARAEAAEARAEKAERERDAAISDLTYIARTYPVDLCDDLVCQYCKHYQNVNTGCPGWTENDCFEWRGQKEE